MESRRLLAIFAHPDDESLGNGGMLARYAAEGVETHLVTATRGERGWFGAAEDYPGPAELGRIREGELRAAAEVLGIADVTLLDYVDGELDAPDPEEVITRLSGEIARVRPHAVVTFDPYGLYGHPDHIAISRFATEAVRRANQAADALYYMAWTQDTIDLYQQAFGEIVMDVDGEARRPVAWPERDVDVRIDASDYWETAWRAIACHRSQLPGYESLLALPAEYHRTLWSNQTYSVALGRRPLEAGVSGTLFGGEDRGRRRGLAPALGA